MHPTRRRVLAAGAAVAATAPFPAAAQDAAAFPSRPIRFILPFPPGSGTDISARAVAKAITDQTGQAVVVDNRAGGNGLIAAQASAAAPPDGYTVFVTTMTTQAVNLALYRKLPYDPIKDFVPVTRFALSPMLLVVRNTPDQPRNVAELVQLARTKPGGLNYASGNTSSRVAGAVLMKHAGANATHVPYKGTPQGLADLLAGQVDFFFPDLTPVVPLVKDGKLRALGVTGADRIASLPEVRTMSEAGFPIELVTWSGAYVPTGTPRPIVERLNALLLKGLDSQEYKDITARSGSRIAPLSLEAFGAFTLAEVDRWGSAVRAANIEPE